MPVVLGIDAAWTSRNPSGVALVCNQGSTWRLAAVAPSCEKFCARADVDHAGSLPNPRALLNSAIKLLGHKVDLVAVDIPLATGPIVGRRVSDNAVSREYGSRKCGTHTPSAERPGQISDELRNGFAQAGYPLQTCSISLPGLIEVYPHPALVEFADATERISYKASKIRNYWPKATRIERRDRLLGQWAKIVELLESRIQGVKKQLVEVSSTSPASDLKACEDMIDAVVCAAVAICALENQASPFGDQESAIWIPNPSHSAIRATVIE